MKSILVLEDDPANLQMFAALLWSKGHRVIEASTAREALDAAQREERLDLLVSDLVLFGDQMSGTGVATAVLDSHGNLPIMFVTGTPLDLWDPPDRQNLRVLLSKACVEVLEKPFKVSAFDSAVQRLLQLNAVADAINRSPAPLAVRPISGIATTAARRI